MNNTPNPLDEIFGFLYKPEDHLREVFGDRWCGPDKFDQLERHLVATYRTHTHSDGQDVDVYCIKAPAVFYEIVALPSLNSVEKPIEGFVLSTGSGEKELAQWTNDTAVMIMEGCLGCRKSSA